MENGMTVTVEKIGHEDRAVIGWDRNKKYTDGEKAEIRKDFVKKAKEGFIINLTDLFISHGF